MEQITRAETRREAVRVGVDLAKRVIQVHAIDVAGHVTLPRFDVHQAKRPSGRILH